MAEEIFADDAEHPAFYHGKRIKAASHSENWNVARVIACQSALDLLLVCTEHGVEILSCSKFLSTLAGRADHDTWVERHKQDAMLVQHSRHEKPWAMTDPRLVVVSDDGFAAAADASGTVFVRSLQDDSDFKSQKLGAQVVELTWENGLACAVTDTGDLFTYSSSSSSGTWQRLDYGGSDAVYAAASDDGTVLVGVHIPGQFKVVPASGGPATTIVLDPSGGDYSQGWVCQISKRKDRVILNIVFDGGEGEKQSYFVEGVLEGDQFKVSGHCFSGFLQDGLNDATKKIERFMTNYSVYMPSWGLLICGHNLDSGCTYFSSDDELKQAKSPWVGIFPPEGKRIDCPATLDGQGDTHLRGLAVFTAYKGTEIKKNDETMVDPPVILAAASDGTISVDFVDYLRPYPAPTGLATSSVAATPAVGTGFAGGFGGFGSKDASEVEPPSTLGGMGLNAFGGGGGGGLFGNSGAAEPTGFGGGFGSAKDDTTKKDLFGSGALEASPAKPSTGLFGGAASNSGGLFGSTIKTEEKKEEGGGLFGGGAFGQSAFGGGAKKAEESSSSNILGAMGGGGGGLFDTPKPPSSKLAPAGDPPAPPEKGGLFGGDAPKPSPPAFAGFGSTAADEKKTTSMFGGAPAEDKPPAPSMFGGGAPAEEKKSGGLFGGGGFVEEKKPQPPAGGFFGQPAPDSSQPPLPSEPAPAKQIVNRKPEPVAPKPVISKPIEKWKPRPVQSRKLESMTASRKQEMESARSKADSLLGAIGKGASGPLDTLMKGLRSFEEKLRDAEGNEFSIEVGGTDCITQEVEDLTKLVRDLKPMADDNDFSTQRRHALRAEIANLRQTAMDMQAQLLESDFSQGKQREGAPQVDRTSHVTKLREKCEALRKKLDFAERKVEDECMKIDEKFADKNLKMEIFGYDQGSPPESALPNGTRGSSSASNAARTTNTTGQKAGVGVPPQQQGPGSLAAVSQRQEMSVVPSSSVYDDQQSRRGTLGRRRNPLMRRRGPGNSAQQSVDGGRTLKALLLKSGEPMEEPSAEGEYSPYRNRRDGNFNTLETSGPSAAENSIWFIHGGLRKHQKRCEDLLAKIDGFREKLNGIKAKQREPFRYAPNPQSAGTLDGTEAVPGQGNLRAMLQMQLHRFAAGIGPADGARHSQVQLGATDPLSAHDTPTFGQSRRESFSKDSTEQSPMAPIVSGDSFANNMFGAAANQTIAGIPAPQKSLPAVPLFGATETKKADDKPLFGGVDKAASPAKNVPSPPTADDKSPAGISSSNAPSLFGASSNAFSTKPAEPAGGLFGAPAAKTEDKPAESSGGLFGAPSSGGLFGAKTDDKKDDEKPAATAGLFGAAPADDKASGGGLFGAVKTEEKKEDGKSVADEYRARITKIYEEHNKDKVKDIDALLTKHAGKEHPLYERICKKYNITAESEYTGPAKEVEKPAGGSMFGGSFGQSFGAPKKEEESSGGEKKDAFSGGLFGASSGGLFGDSKKEDGEKKSPAFGGFGATDDKKDEPSSLFGAVKKEEADSKKEDPPKAPAFGEAAKEEEPKAEQKEEEKPKEEADKKDEETTEKKEDKPAGGLFGAPASSSPTAATGGGLFGAAASSSGGLFGAVSTPPATAAPADAPATPAKPATEAAAPFGAAAAAATPPAKTVNEEYLERIQNVYKEKQPDKVAGVPALLTKHAGKEHALYMKVCQKYGATALPEYTGAAATAAAPAVSVTPPATTSGFGGFGAASTSTGGGFGAAATAGGSSPFGAAPAANASTGGFGSFGQPAGGATTGFGSFGTTSPTPAPAAGGSSPFGAAPATGGGFGGLSAAAPAAAPAASPFGANILPANTGGGFGGFGASAPASGGGFGQTSSFGQPSTLGGGGGFGQPAAAPAAAGAAKTVTQEYQERIQAIYQTADPSKVAGVPALLQKHAGKEHAMYLKICQKYNVPNPQLQYMGPGGAAGAAPAAASGGGFAGFGGGAATGGFGATSPAPASTSPGNPFATSNASGAAFGAPSAFGSSGGGGGFGGFGTNTASTGGGFGAAASTGGGFGGFGASAGGSTGGFGAFGASAGGSGGQMFGTPTPTQPANSGGFGGGFGGGGGFGQSPNPAASGGFGTPGQSGGFGGGGGFGSSPAPAAGGNQWTQFRG